MFKVDPAVKSVSCTHKLFVSDLVQKSHLALMDALMSLAAKETVGRVKMAAEAEQMGVGSPWENALLFWVNRVRPCCCFSPYSSVQILDSQFYIEIMNFVNCFVIIYIYIYK